MIMDLAEIPDERESNERDFDDSEGTVISDAAAESESYGIVLADDVNFDGEFDDNMYSIEQSDVEEQDEQMYVEEGRSSEEPTWNDDIEVLQSELSQSAYEVCELQLHNEMLVASNMELKKRVEILTALCQKYSDSALGSNVAYQNSLERVRGLNSLLNTVRFGANSLVNDEKTRFYTGLPSEKVFNTIFTALKPLAGKKNLPVH